MFLRCLNNLVISAFAFFMPLQVLEGGLCPLKKKTNKKNRPQQSIQARMMPVLKQEAAERWLVLNLVFSTFQPCILCVCVWCVCSVMSDSLWPHGGAHQAPLSMEFPMQEYWSGLTFPTPGDLINPGVESASLASPALADKFFTTSATWEVSLGTGT